MQRAVMTPEKAERLVRVIEQILSRHTGKDIKINGYRIVPNDPETRQEKIG